jgi:SAM-dependent methyltransferase
MQSVLRAAVAGVVCEVCGGDPPYVFDARGYPMFRCGRCRYTFTAPPRADLANIYDDGYFSGGGDGSGYPDYLAEGALLRKRGARYGRLLNRYTPPGRILDVGAAAGFILQGYLDAGWSGTGVEVNGSMAAYARDRLGLDVHTGSLESLSVTERFDVVSFIQVAAHFIHLRAALGRAAELTVPRGWWLFETWNSESLAARIFGRNWHAYSPPSAVRALSPHALDAFVAPFGFKPVAYGKPRKVIDARHAKFALSTMSRTSLLARAARGLAGVVPDRTRIAYPAVDVFWALYRRP